MERDSVSFSYEESDKNNKKNGLLFSKSFPDRVYQSFNLYSNKKRRFGLKTIYMVSADYEKKKSAKPLPMNNSSASTSLTHGGQTSTDSIARHTANGNTKSLKSDRDSSGRELTPQQQEYFKDSKVRDENGWLKVMYDVKLKQNKGLPQLGPQTVITGRRPKVPNSTRLSGNPFGNSVSQNATNSNTQSQKSDREQRLETLKNVESGNVPFENGTVEIGEFPKIYSELFPVGKLPFVMNVQHLYTNLVTKEKAIADNKFSKKNGEHYRGYGTEFMEKAIEAAYHPAAIIDTWRTKKWPHIALALNVEGVDVPLYGVLQFYAMRQINGSADTFTHAMITIYERDKLPAELMDATKNGKLLYIDIEQLSAGATVAKAYGNMTDTALKNNLSLFNEKIKVYKENRRIKYSHRDTSGRKLNPQQQEYFKDSNIRDSTWRSF